MKAARRSKPSFCGDRLTGLAIPRSANPARCSPPAGGCRRSARGRLDVPWYVQPRSRALQPVDRARMPPGGIDRVKLGELIGLLRQIGIPVQHPQRLRRPPSRHGTPAVQPSTSTWVLAGQPIAIERLLLDSQPLASRRVGRGINDAKLWISATASTPTTRRSGRRPGLLAASARSTTCSPCSRCRPGVSPNGWGPPWSQLVAPCVLREVDGQLGSLSLERPGSVGRDASQHGELRQRPPGSSIG